jgi:uncharacterized membrane protein
MLLRRLKRWWVHETTGSRALKRALPPEALERLSAAVIESEKKHSGEIRVALESSLAPSLIWRDTTDRERALQVFSDLGVWDTEHNNGVLLYLLLADHDVEIIADRGIDRVVGAEGWAAICRDMEAHFRAGHFEEGLLRGITGISGHLEAHFPLNGERSADALPNMPVVLG